MKNFLKSISILVAIFIWAFYISLTQANAQMATDSSELANQQSVKQKFYEKIVQSWGFEVQPQAQNITIIQEPNTQVNQTTDIQIDTISDQQSTNNIYQTAYTISTKQNLKFIFYDRELNLQQLNLISYQLGFDDIYTNQPAQYYLGQDNDLQTYYINQQYIADANLYAKTRVYFEGLYRAKYSKDTKSTQINVNPYIPNAVAIESFGYAIIMFLFAIITYKFALLVNRHKKNSLKIISIESHNLLLNVLILAQRINPYAYMTLIFLLGILFYLSILVSFTNKNDLDLNYILKQIVDLTSISQDVEIFKTRNLVNITVLIMARALQVNLLIIVIPRIIDFCYKTLPLIKRHPINSDFIKNTIINLLIVCLFMITVTDLSSSYILITSILLLITILIIPFLKSSLPKFTTKQKLLYSIITIIIVFLGLGYKIYTKNNQKQTINDLFAINNAQVIFLPYQKDIDGVNPHFIQKKIISANFMIFADNYLIYDPSAKTINHIKVSEIPEHQNDNLVILTSQNYSNLASLLLKDQNLRSLFISESPTDTIYWQNSVKNQVTTYRVNLQIDCKDQIKASDLYLTYQQDSSDQDQNKKLKKLFFAKFAGCDNGSPNSNLNIILNEPLYLDEYIFKLQGIDQANIISFDILADQTLMPKNYLDNTNGQNIIQIKKQKSDAIYVLNLDKQKTLNLPSPQHDPKKGIDLSQNINTLIKSGLLKESFTIWSPEPNALIYSKYEE